MKKLIFVLFALVIAPAFAAEDPSFTLRGASRAFQTGHVPTEQELVGPWMQVGSTDSLGKTSAYVADGWYITSKTHERYRFVTEFKVAATDAFKVNRYSSKSQWSYESGKTAPVDFWQTDKWSSEDTGVYWVQFVPSQHGNRINCGMTTECRIIPVNGMLLCDTRMTGHRFCTDVSNVHDYMGYVRPN